MAGYSGTPLLKKIGIKAGQTVALIAPPRGFRPELGDLPEGVKVAHNGGALDVIVFFAGNRAQLYAQLSPLARKMKATGMLWVDWRKKGSGVATDLNENLVRDAGLAAGLVDIKVCAGNEIWSGLKFVVPVKNRAAYN